MGMFKKKATVEELLEAVKELTDEEKAEFVKSLGSKEEPAAEGTDEKGKGEEGSKEEPPAPEENGSEGGGDNGESDEPEPQGDDEDNEGQADEGQAEEQEDLRAMVVALEARVAALEKAKEQAADSEVGAGDDLADTDGVFHKMPESYVEQAKKMRF